MSTMNMKRIFSCLLLGASCLLANAQGLVIYKTDGSQIKIPIEQLENISFYDEGNGPDVPPDTNVTPITVENLIASEWEDGGLDFSNGYTMTFTAEQVTVMQGEEVAYQGSYTLEDNVVSFFMNGTTYKSFAGLAGGGSVLIMKEIYDEGPENLGFVLVQKGKTISTKKEDIQGQWLWWDEYTDNEGNDVKIVRLSYKFEGDNFEVIITPWGQRYTGTYTYENGIAKLSFQQGYTSREEGTGYGVGEGDLDPVTLECNWKPLYEEYWPMQDMEGPYFVVGDEACAILMMPSVCVRKK